MQKSILQISDWRHGVVVARNPNQAKRVMGFAQRLKLNIAVIHSCYGRESETEEIDERSSPPPIATGLDTIKSVSARRSVHMIPSLNFGEGNYRRISFRCYHNIRTSMRISDFTSP